MQEEFWWGVLKILVKESIFRSKFQKRNFCLLTSEEIRMYHTAHEGNSKCFWGMHTAPALLPVENIYQQYVFCLSLSAKQKLPQNKLIFSPGLSSTIAEKLMLSYRYATTDQTSYTETIAAFQLKNVKIRIKLDHWWSYAKDL